MKKALLLCCIGLLCTALSDVYAQRTITGTITDESGEAIPGAGVQVKDTNKGTSANFKGEYALKEVPDNAVLLFSAVGLEPQEITLGPSDIVNITLIAKTITVKEEREEVVVVGYGTLKKRDITGAVSMVRPEEINELPVPGIDQALQGRATGVFVSKSNGQPGGGVNIRVRGPGSISAGTDPLYVIDGIPLQSENRLSTLGDLGGVGGQNLNSISDLNWNDVASIEILKDASATAVYGSRAANGVVIITTKKGKRGGKAQFNVGSYIGSTKVFKLPEMLNATQYKELTAEALVNGNEQPVTFGNADTDWMNEIFQTGFIYGFDFSAQGGSENLSYFASFSVMDQEGTLKGTGFKRYGGRLNLDANITKRFKIGTNLNFNYSENQIQFNDNFILGPYFSALRSRTDLPVRDEFGNLTATNTFDNPVGATEYENFFDSYRFLGSVFGELSIIDGLSLRTSFNVDYSNLLQDQYATNTLFLGSLFGKGYAQRGYNEQTNVIWENYLTYAKNFNEKHDLNIVAGTAVQKNVRETLLASATDFPNNSFKSFTTAATPLNVDGNGSSNGLTSFFLRANYAFDKRYSLMVTARTDGSSRFGVNNKYGFFPAIGAAWNIMNENFMKNASAVDNLRFRMSYGLTGNQDIDDFSQRGLFGASGLGYADDGGIAPTQIENPDLTWEKTRQVDFGIEFGLFQNRLRGGLGYYGKNTVNMLLAQPVAPSVGFTSFQSNVGQMRNRGIEIDLGGDIIRTDNFTWSTNLTFATLNSKITKLVDGQDILLGFSGSSILREGEAISSFYGWRVAGIFQNQAEVDNSAVQKPDTAPGDFKFEDINSDGVINDADRVIIGNALPKFFGGFRSSWSFKGLQLTAFFNYSAGNDVLYFAEPGLVAKINSDNSTTEALERWQKEGDVTDVPRAVWGDPNQNQRTSDRWVHDGSFLRLSQLQLSYNFSKDFLEKINLFKSIRIYAQGTNLLTVTSYPGVDPEVASRQGSRQQRNAENGLDNNTYPNGKTYTFGINFGF